MALLGAPQDSVGLLVIETSIAKKGNRSEPKEASVAFPFGVPAKASLCRIKDEHLLPEQVHVTQKKRNLDLRCLRKIDRWLL